MKCDSLETKKKTAHQTIMNVGTYAMCILAEFTEYNWDDAVCRSQAKEAFDKINAALKDIDFSIFSVEELAQFRFLKFSDNMLCCPLYMKTRFFPGKEYDADHRAYQLAYGWPIQDGKVCFETSKKV